MRKILITLITTVLFTSPAFAGTCLVAIANHTAAPRSTIIKHETGHCVCPNWTHGAFDMSSVTPPKPCRGAYNGQLVTQVMPRAEVQAMCHGADACVIDIW